MTWMRPSEPHGSRPPPFLAAPANGVGSTPCSGSGNAAGQRLLDPLFPKFLLYDSNGDGTIDVHEFRHLIKSTTGMNPPREEFDQLMRAADVDGDGGITFAEFKHFCDTNSGVGKSLREAVMQKLLAFEEAALNASSPLFETTPSAAMLGVSAGIGRTASAIKRLTLTRRARACSTLCSLVLLALAAGLAFGPFLKLSDIAVPDAFDIGKLKEEFKRMDRMKELEECKNFLTTHCPDWSPGDGWTKSDFRRCSLQCHPDKPNGSESKFRQLKDCNQIFEDLSGPFRQAQYWVLLGLYVGLMTDFVLVAALSSTSAALVYVTLQFSSPVDPVLATALPDLEDSYRLFIVLSGCSLALGTSLLAKFRGQPWLGGWLAGARVCRVSDGLPASTMRVLALDVAQGLTDAALVALSVLLPHPYKSVLAFAMFIGMLISSDKSSFTDMYPVIFIIYYFPDPVLMSTAVPAVLAIAACVVQHCIASWFALRFGGRSLAEFFTGTVLLCVKVDGRD
jgi:hypothetical protein